MKRIIKEILLFGFTSMLTTSGFTASQITVDENGHGTWTTSNSTNPLAWTLAPDPTQGLLNWNVLIYSLPFAGVAGDVLITEPVRGNPIGDVLRFDGKGDLIFYSDSVNGYQDLADTPGTPNPFLPNIAGPFPEVLLNGLIQGIDYTPGPGQPGFDPIAAPSYTFVSDVPEPGVGLLILSGLGVVALAHIRCRRGFTQCARRSARNLE